MIAISVGIIIMSFFVSSWMIIHLGMKPDSGGSPPRDSIRVRMVEAIKGTLFHVCERDKVVVDVLSINNINVDRVIKIYRDRFRNIIVGL